MKPEVDVSELVAALRDDLPTADDSRRLRARLAALGIATGATLSGSAAGASTLVAQGTATAAGGLFSQAAALSWGAKLGLAAAVSASAVAGSAALLRAAGSGASSAAPRSHTAQMPPLASAGLRRGAGAEASARAPKFAGENELGVAHSGAPLQAAGAARAFEAAPSIQEPRPVGPRPGPAASHAEPDLQRRPIGDGRQSALQSEPAFDGRQPASASSGSFAIAQEELVETSLREETELIDRAFAALRAGNRNEARQLISDHARRFPDGLLGRERERARAKLAELSGL